MATTKTTPTEGNPKQALPSDPLQAASARGMAKKPPSSTSSTAPIKVPAGELKAASTATRGNDAGPVTDTQKKIRRAERFGMAVQLSEEEKRSSRAERFGSSSGTHVLDATKKSEELKRKARAERFGIGQTVSTDEDEKKKARLARFAPVSSSGSVEEDKRKARALRFSDSLINGKGKSEPKAAIAGDARPEF